MLTVTTADADPSPAVPACTSDAPCHLRMRDPSTLITYKGDTFTLPPGRFLDENTYSALDTEWKRLQDQETRLTAENKSFRKTMDTWQPGWITLTIATLSGIATGVTTYYLWTHR